MAPAWPAWPPPVARTSTSIFPPVFVTSRGPKIELTVALAGEIIVEGAAVDLDLPRAWGDPHPSDRRLPPANAPRVTAVALRLLCSRLGRGSGGFCFSHDL